MKLKILVVDDTKNIRSLLTTCLEIEGYSVKSASDGEQALKLLGSEDFDLVFLDIKLPEYSGTEVLRRMRAVGIETPVIIMTAFATVKNAVECTKMGALAYLQKPFSAEKIKQVMETVTKEQKLPPDLSEPEQVIEGLMTRGELDLALRKLTRYIGTHPLSGNLYLLLARIYEAQGKPVEAEKAYSVAKQLSE